MNLLCFFLYTPSPIYKYVSDDSMSFLQFSVYQLHIRQIRPDFSLAHPRVARAGYDDYNSYDF